MARINLLPWRQAERERKNKEFLALAGAVAAIAIIGVMMTMTFLGNALDNQLEANAYIEQANQDLDKVAEEIATLEQQREEMLSRMKIIQDLQGQRSIPVRVWDDIARAVPQAMYLVGMKREDDTITITGFADNPNTISQLVRNLDASPWLADSGVPNIQTEIQAYSTPRTVQTNRQPLPEDTYIQFTVTTKVKIDVPKKEGEEGAEQSGGAPQAPSESAPVVTPAPTTDQPVAVAQPATPESTTPVAPTSPSETPAPAVDPAVAPPPVSSAPAPTAPSAGGQ